MNNKAYILLATSRSGHHAVAQWMCSHFPGVINIVNDCRDGLKRGSLDGRPEEFSSEEYHFRNDGPWKGTLYTFERAMPDELAPAYGLLKDRDVTTAIVVRDHYNWVASLMNIGVPVTEDRISCWKALMKEVSKPVGQSSLPELVGINFNLWFENGYWRDCLLRRLHLSYCEHSEQINHVSEFGGGSSFDGFEKQDNAQNMKVLDRWRKFAESSEYLDVVTRPDLVKLTDAYFGFNPLERARA